MEIIASEMKYWNRNAQVDDKVFSREMNDK
jgi:hypothetical protein